MSRTTTEDGGRPWWRRTVGVRARLLIWYVLLFSLSLFVAVLTIRQVLLARVDNDLENRLAQEAAELRLLAGGTDPATGQPFGRDAQALFTKFLSRNVPDGGESFSFLIDGRPFATSADAPLVLLEDEDLVRRWSAVDGSAWGDSSTAQGPVRWLAVPVGDGQTTLGTFVVSRFYQRELNEVEAAVRVIAVVSLLVLVLASGLAWLTAGRVVAPIRRLTIATRYVSDHDLSTRLPVTGNDEVTELTRTFNSMLDRLEAAFGTQRRFLDDIGHELRTPITIVRGHLELMPDNPDERGETIAMCLDELDRMNRYVSDLILLARSERPDFVRYGPVDLAELTYGIAKRARAIGPEHDWVVEKADQAALEADGERLTQAWLNLVSNAARHTNSGTTVRLGGAVDDGWASMWVADNGPGIAPEDHQAIFERFRQGGNGHVPHRDSSGLGLAIVTAIARAHGGHTDLRSDPVAGSRFTIVVPVAAPNLEEVSSP